MIVDIDFFNLPGYIREDRGSDEDTISWITENYGTANLNLISVITGMMDANDPIISLDAVRYKASKRLLYEYMNDIIEDQNLVLRGVHGSGEIVSTDLVYLKELKSEKIEERILSEINGVMTVVMNDEDTSRQYMFTSIEEVPEGHYVVIHSSERLPVEVRDLSMYSTTLENEKEEVRNVLRNTYKIEKRLTDINNFFNVWITLDPITS